MSDIVERLRDRDAMIISGLFHAVPAMREAADEIEALRRLIKSIACQNDPAWAVQLARDWVKENS